MIPAMSTDRGGFAHLLCPHCGAEQMHHGAVEIFDRPEDAPSASHVVVDGESIRIDRDGTGNPSLRRHGLRIRLWCEICSSVSQLNIAQHKGDTRLWVEVLEVRDGEPDE